MTSRNVLTPARWLAVLPVLVLWLLCLPGTASAAGTTAVSVLASTQSFAAGEQFTVSIAVIPDTAIAGMQFDLSFDASLVAVGTVQEGDLLNQDGATSYFNSGAIDNEAGKVTGVFGAITTPGMTVSTPGTFATITLTAKRQSNGCPLSLSNVIVGDKEGHAVPVSLDNEGPPSATIQRQVFRWWVLSVIVGVALVIIAATIVGILIRRRQMVSALETRKPHR